MALALTLHQIGVPCAVLEAVPELQAREWALVGRNGNDLYAEPRGLLAAAQLARREAKFR